MECSVLAGPLVWAGCYEASWLMWRLCRGLSGSQSLAVESALGSGPRASRRLNARRGRRVCRLPWRDSEIQGFFVAVILEFRGLGL